MKALRSVGYTGLVILHTYALNYEAADHHHTSFKRFQEMKAALSSSSQTSKRTSLVALSEAGRRSQSSRITAEAWRASRQKIRSASLEAKIDYLLDRAEIEDIITTYAYSVDTRDMPLHGELFKESFGQNHRVVQNQERLQKVGRLFKLDLL